MSDLSDRLKSSLAAALMQNSPLAAVPVGDLRQAIISLDSYDALSFDDLFTQEAELRACESDPGETVVVKRATLHKVLDGFHESVFIRNAGGDGEAGWAVKLLPFIMALRDLAIASGYADAPEKP